MLVDHALPLAVLSDNDVPQPQGIANSRSLTHSDHASGADCVACKQGSLEVMQKHVAVKPLASPEAPTTPYGRGPGRPGPH